MTVSRSTLVTLGLTVAGIAAAVWLMSPGSRPAAQTVQVTVPQLSTQARFGKVAFDANCAACHGRNAAGTDQGPPLIHDFYNPGHHADQAFVLAAQRGVRAHHWTFGNMPPQPQVSDQEIQAIIRYIRELQVANGITDRPHRM